MRRRGEPIDILGQSLQVWINPKLPVEAKAALAARVMAKADREGYLSEDMFDHIVISANPNANRSTPSNMRFAVDRDPNLFTFGGVRDLLRLGYRIKLLQPIEGASTGTVRFLFADQDSRNFAYNFGLGVGSGTGLRRALSVTRMGVDSSQHLVDVRSMWDEGIADILIDTATDELIIMPKWRGHKIFKDEGKLVTVR